MSYFETYKNRLTEYGGNSSNERLRNTEHIIESEFRNDPSYRSALLYKPNNITLPIDVRIVNYDKSSHDKKIYVMPKTVVDVGCYITFEDNTYLVTEVEDNLISPCCVSRLCNQPIYLPNGKIVASFVEGESYGVKLIGGNDYFDSVDAKVKITIADTKENRRLIKQDTRVCFGFSEFGIYKIGDISVYDKGLLVCIAQKDKYMEGLDNLETGVMYQRDINEIEEYEIIGLDSIKINEEYEYQITPSANCIFVSDSAHVDISQGSGKCTLIATTPDEVFTLTARVGNVILASKNIFATRW